jgi:hypothetical protein
VLDIMQLRTYARAKKVVENPKSDKKTFADAGIPESLVTQVMTNVLHAKRWRPPNG